MKIWVCDSDSKIGPFSDAIILEGEQDFDEDKLSTDGNGPDGNGDGNLIEQDNDDDEEFNHTENLNAIKAMDLKKFKLELYLQLEISSGKKSELQECLLEVICLKKAK